MEPGQKPRTLIWILLCLLLSCWPACARRTSPPLPRIAQGHVQWLEKQSMLGGTQTLTRQVSASERLWQSSVTSSKIDLLLETAPNWLALSPYLTKTAPGSFFTALSTSPLLDKLPSFGISGLFLAPTGERSDVWTSTGDTKPVSARGENVCALRFDAQLGTEKDFEHLARRLDRQHVQLGGKIVPTATGLGPDFMLQARNATRYEGLYAMLNVPKEDWEKMPLSESEWDCRNLDAAQQQYLATKGIIPNQLIRDTLAWASPGGWAITGQVRGVDGNLRRWVYRYAHSELRPLLLWQDPSGQARRIFSGSVIRHTGFQRQVLAGISMEPLLGLEAGEHDTGLASGLNAIEQLGLEIHRYGGWSIHTDALPPNLWPKLLRDGLDFFADHATQVATLAALETGNAGPLVAHFANTIALRIPHKRLARGLEQDVANAAMTTMAGRVAQIMRKQHTRIGSHEVREAMLLLLGIRAGLPGLCFVSPEELTGATTLEPSPVWAGEQPSCLFGSLARQWEDSKSFVHQIRVLLQKRQSYGLASGTLEHIENIADGGIAFVNALPREGHWITIANVSDKTILGKISLPYGDGIVRDIFGGEMSPASGRKMAIKLMPYEIRHVVFSKH